MLQETSFFELTDVRFEVSFLLKRSKTNVARMLSDVAVNEHVVLHLRLLSKLLVANIAYKETALRRQKVRPTVLLHILETLEGSVA